MKSPWKGPYIITEIKSPVLYKIKDRKKEEVVHHDRIKLCQNKNHPLWLSRLRNNVLKNYCNLEHDITDNSELEVEDYNLDKLFQVTEKNGISDIQQSMTSDTLMPLSGSDTGISFNPEIDNKRVRKKPKYLDDYDLKN